MTAVASHGANGDLAGPDGGGAITLHLGCASLTRPTVRKHFTDEALPRASFEMQCPKENIELVQLGTALDEPVANGSQVGVKGCGKQAVYVCSPSGWVANTATTEPAPH